MCNTFSLSRLECIELHLNITPFEGYPQLPGSQGQTKTDSETNSKRLATIVSYILFCVPNNFAWI